MKKSKELTLSVVLPVYNVDQWLDECLESLLVQTRPADEIIVIDDGSTDSSPDILEKYTNKYPQIKVFSQENAGLSVARNNGLKHVSSDYLVFIDSDDFVSPNMFEHLLELLEDGKLDIAMCNAYMHYEGRQEDSLVFNDSLSSKIVKGKEWLRHRLLDENILHMVWMHMYRTSFIKKNGFEFVPGQVHEDVIWTNQVFMAAELVQYLNLPLYFYRVRQTERSGLDQVRRSREYVIPCSIRNVEAIVGMAGSIQDDKELSDLMRWQAVDGGFSVFHLIEKLPEKRDRLKQMNKLWEDGFFRLMWQNANSFRYKKKLIRLFLRKIFRII